MKMMRCGFLLLVALASAISAQAFYIPGLTVQPYVQDAPVDVWVNSLRSLSNVVPYDYYKLPFCQPSVRRFEGQRLGELMWGDSRQSSLYTLHMLKNVSCEVLDCPASNAKDVINNIDMLDKFINQGYRAGVSIDNLPGFNNAKTIYNGQCTGAIPIEQTFAYQRGYAIGVHKNCIGETLINNHLHFIVQYNKVPVSTKPGQVEYMVVGFNVVPYSIKHQPDGGDCRHNDMFNPAAADLQPLTVTAIRAGAKPVWSFSATWVLNDKITWATRWDSYLATSVADTQYKYHWMWICAGLAVTLTLSLIASATLLRIVNRDISKYNMPIVEGEDEVGWKLVHADVFRPPYRAPTLAAAVGNGAQLLTMFCGVVAFGLFGMLSPAWRGMLLTAIILLFIFMSFAGGAVAGQYLKFFDAHEWKHVFLCAFGFPCLSCIVYFVGDIIDTAVGASDAVPFMTLLTLLGMYLGLAVPLTVMGASFSFNRATLSVPSKVGKLAREIPVQPFVLSPAVVYTIPAAIPLACILAELVFMFESIWQGTVYYVFGFLGLTFVMWVMVTALVTIIVIFTQLCHEDHQWWWRAFMVPGTCGAHLFVYCLYYFYSQLNITSGPATGLYFLYMGLLSVAYGLMAGCIGVTASFAFVRKIFGSIKVE